MSEARKAGYRIVLVYVALKDPELHIERVRLRVREEGRIFPILIFAAAMPEA